MARARVLSGVGLVLLALGVVAPSGAVAQTTITNCDGQEPLIEAVQQGGAYVFDCPGVNHTIYLSAPLEVTRPVSLDATGESVIIRNNNDRRAFDVTAGTLELVNLRVFSSERAPAGTSGGAGTPGIHGETGTSLPCAPESVGMKAGDGGDGVPPLDDAGDGADGADRAGGVIAITAGATATVRGGELSGTALGGGGGAGGIGGYGGGGGQGGSPVGDWLCFQPIYGGDTGVGTDGAPGGDGGDGGDARGGAVYVAAGGTLNMTGTRIWGSGASGGRGGSGGLGGVGGWAGWIARGGSPIQGPFPYMGHAGDYSGRGGRGGDGGASGEGLGGAIYSEGTVSLTDVRFDDPRATNGGGGNGGLGGNGGNGNGAVGPPIGNGGNGGDGGSAAASVGGAIYSTGTLNVYSAVFDGATAGSNTSMVGSSGGAGGRGGNAPAAEVGSGYRGGNGGTGRNGGDASWASIFGAIGVAGCASFVDSRVGPGAPGAGGAAGTSGSEPPGNAGLDGFAGSGGPVDPTGFSPYPCPNGPVVEGPPGSAACSDGVDNDGDGLVDGDDPGCKESGAPGTGGSPPAATPKPPRVKLTVAKSQALAGPVTVTVSCPAAACVATASGSLDVPVVKAAKRYALGKARKRIAKGGKAKLRLTVARKSCAAAKRALRGGKRVKAKISVVVTGADGGKRALSRTVRLTLP